jgi:hypothetical protein
MSARVGRGRAERSADRFRGLRDGFGEEILNAAAEVKERSGDDGAEALEEQKAGARIDVCMGLTLEGAAERDEKEQGNGNQLQLMGRMSHGKFLRAGPKKPE